MRPDHQILNDEILIAHAARTLGHDGLDLAILIDRAPPRRLPDPDAVGRLAFSIPNRSAAAVTSIAIAGWRTPAWRRRARSLRRIDQGALLEAALERPIELSSEHDAVDLIQRVFRRIAKKAIQRSAT